MRRLVLAAIAIIGAAFAVPAFAAPVNITAPLSTAGALSTEERLPDRDYVLIQPRVFQTRFVYGADGATGLWATTYRAVTVDSSTAIPTKGYKQLALMFQFVVDDSVAAALFALQTRGHMTAGVDTLSTYAWPNTYRSAAGAAQPPFTTNLTYVCNSGQTVLHGSAVGAFSSIPLGARIVGSGIAPNTFVVSRGTSDSALTISQATATAAAATALTVIPTFTAAADTIGSAVESALSRFTQPGSAGIDTAYTGPGERPMWVVWSQGLVGQNTVVMINGADGVPFTAPYMSWRLRLMNTFNENLQAWGSGGAAYGSANKANAGTGNCEMCNGHPARNALGRSVTVTADLVGWR